MLNALEKFSKDHIRLVLIQMWHKLEMIGGKWHTRYWMYWWGMVRCGWPPEASCSAASAAAVVVAASFAHGSVAGSAASHSTDAGPTYQFINNSFDLVSNTSKAKQVNVKSSFKSSPSFFFLQAENKTDPFNWYYYYDTSSGLASLPLTEAAPASSSSDEL